MPLFDNGEPEEFLLFIRNFNMTLATSGTLEAGAKYQYLCNIFCREALRHFESLSYYWESTQTPNGHDIIKGLSQYCFPVNLLFKEKITMRREMKNHAI